MPPFPDHLPLPDGRLRPLAAEDLPAVLRQLSDPRVGPWLAAIPAPVTEAEGAALLELAQDPAEGLRVLEIGGAVAGCVRMAPAFWYWLDPAHWGQGVMRRSLAAAIDAHVAAGGAPLVATVREGNAASAALLHRLGFARGAKARRMFFQATGRAEPCHDYHLTPEQWLVLNPPVVLLGKLTLRPATARDGGLLARLLPRPGSADAARWPRAEGCADFLETHRCRRPEQGLFVIEDDLRRALGMVLLGPERAMLLDPHGIGAEQETLLRQHLAGLGRD